MIGNEQKGGIIAEEVTSTMKPATINFNKQDAQHIEQRAKASRFFENFNRDFIRLYNAETELSEILRKVGEKIKVAPPLEVKYGNNTTLENGVHINIGTRIDDSAPVCIGEGVLTGPYLKIITTKKEENGIVEAQEVNIERDVWIGGGVVIKPGVTIGEGSVIAAGSVVESDVPPNSVVVGSPAKSIKEINKPEDTPYQYLQGKTGKERMIDGETFYTSAPDLVKAKQEAYEFFNNLNHQYAQLDQAEKELGKILKTGEGITLETPFYFSFGFQIDLGNNITFGKGVFLGDAGKIKICNNVTLGDEVQIYTTNHLLNKTDRAYIDTKDVTIEDGAQIGKSSIILPGVTIGEGAIIEEGSVVKDNVLPHSRVAGIPAEPIK